MFEDIKKIYEYREMLKNMVKKELRARYKGSVLGFFWTFLNPILMLIIYSVVFSTVMKVNIPKYNYTIFLFVGLVPWLFTSATLQQSTSVIIANNNLVKKIYFPRIILPMSTSFTNLVNMVLTFVIVIVALIIYKAPFGYFYFMLPVVVAIHTILVLAVSIIISCVTVYFRDLEHITNILITAWFYLTPIVYPFEFVPKEYMIFFKFNPMLTIINSYRDIFMYGLVPKLNEMLYVFIFSSLMLIVGYFLFYKLQRKFAEEL